MPRTVQISSDGTAARTFVTVNGLRLDNVLAVEWRIDMVTKKATATLRLKDVDVDLVAHQDDATSPG